MKANSLTQAGLRLLVICHAAAARVLTSTENNLVADAVSRDFKDPSSAKFRWLPFPDCMGNAKNSFGAYVSFKPFRVYFGTKDGKTTFLRSLDSGNRGDWRESFFARR
jgi:hypothetical protein